MINPSQHTAKSLRVIAERLQEWPENTDFVYLDGDTIHYVQGGSAASINYISREQWAAAKTLQENMQSVSRHPIHFKDVSGLSVIDPFMVIRLFEVADPELQDAVRKILMLHDGTRASSAEKDIRDARDSLNRWLEIKAGR